MKKKIYSGVAVLAVAAVAGWNVSLGTRGNSLSDVSLANVEALAQGESSGTTDCWHEVSSSNWNAMSAELTHKTYCGDCRATLCRSWYTQSNC